MVATERHARRFDGKRERISSTLEYITNFNNNNNDQTLHISILPFTTVLAHETAKIINPLDTAIPRSSIQNFTWNYIGFKSRAPRPDIR